MIRLIFWCCLLLFCSTSLLSSQQTDSNKRFSYLHARIGLLGSYHSAEMPAFAPAVSCGLYPSEFGSGLSFSVGYEKQLSNSLSFGITGMFSQRNVTFSNTGLFPFRDSVSGRVVDAITNNEIAINLQYIEIQPELRLSLAKNLQFIGGLRLGIAQQATLEQRENIISPANAAFVRDGRTVRSALLASGEIADVITPSLALTAGLQYYIPLTQRLDFTQHLAAGYTFTEVVSRAGWNIADIRAELGIRFRLTPDEEEEPTPQQEPTTSRTPQLSVTINDSLTGVRKVYTTLTTAVFPSYRVFFDSGSSIIPNRFLSPAPEKHGFTVEAYRSGIATIVQQFRTNSMTFLMLKPVATNEEIAGDSLALARAESIRRKLIEQGIPSEYIVVENPEIAQVSGLDPQRKAEFQYVSITPEPSFPPFHTKDSTVVEAELLVQATISASIPDKSPVLQLRDTLVQFMDGTSAQLRTLWTIPSDTTVTAFVTTFDSSYAVPLRIEPSDLPMLRTTLLHKELSDNLLLPLFDYNSDVLSVPMVMHLRRALQGLTFQQHDTLEIIGNSDALGTLERNTSLALSRAKAVAEVISKEFSYITYKISSGEVLPGNTPEQRLLRRSVLLRLKSTK